MKKSSIKWIIIALIFTFLIILIPVTFSRYESSATSKAEIQYAFYILKADYFTKNIKLMDIVPRDEDYMYVFTVSNFEGDKRLETKLEYDLWISCTTNLPLEYKLYLNDDMNNNIILSDDTSPDEDGTYFRKLTTNKRNFSYTDNQTDTYYLFIRFPSIYKDSMYADIVENITININSRQITS